MSFTVPIAESDVTNLVSDLALKAPLASPTFTGTPLGPTAAQGTNTTQLATTAMVQSEVTLLAPKASPTFTGTVTVPNGSGATDMAAFGQVPVTGAVGGYAQIVARTSDSSTVSTNSLHTDDQLLLAVGANDRWLFNAFLTMTAANGAGSATTADARFGWSLPASGTAQHGYYATIGQNAAGYGSASTGNSPVALAVDAANSGNSGGAALVFGIALSCFYTGGGTSGNVAVRWAQGTSNAATLQVNTNSILLGWRLA